MDTNTIKNELEAKAYAKITVVLSSATRYSAPNKAVVFKKS